LVGPRVFAAAPIKKKREEPGNKLEARSAVIGQNLEASKFKGKVALC